jgi:hypothetical protein
MLREKATEVRQELALIARGGRRFFDAVLPFALFLLLLKPAGTAAAAGVSFSCGLALSVYRIFRGASPLFSLAGLLVLGIGAVPAVRSGKAGDFLLPNVGTNFMLFLLCLVSLPLRRPLVAWTSYFARRYPLAWYWHPSVRPAYTEVTILWALFFGVRLVLQILLLRSGEEFLLALFSFLSGWPAIVVLLVVSYVYGTWRLRLLGGPGAEEFRRGDPPPWKGQIRGF